MIGIKPTVTESLHCQKRHIPEIQLSHNLFFLAPNDIQLEEEGGKCLHLPPPPL